MTDPRIVKRQTPEYIIIWGLFVPPNTEMRQNKKARGNGLFQGGLFSRQTTKMGHAPEY